jgi:uncharacterized protein (TIGR02757 family)
MTKNQKRLLNYLNDIYAKYNKCRFVSPDPLEFLQRYKNPADREIAALIASSLAYGKVGQILKAVNFVLSKLGRNPKKLILSSCEAELKKIFKNFKYRFTQGSEIVDLLTAIKKTIKKYGSLNRCFLSHFNKKDPTVLKAMSGFMRELGKCPTLIPCPDKKSAFKRMNLFLRWQVRCDNVDPGGWKGIAKSKLIIPLDTHMHKIAKKLRLTERKSADSKTALEITKNFSKLCPADPVKFDFALTRFGIRKELKHKRGNNTPNATKACLKI